MRHEEPHADATEHLFGHGHKQIRAWDVPGPDDPHDDHPVFVLVHGLGVSSDYFANVVDILKTRGRVIVVDLPGFGGLPHPRDPLSIEQFARAVNGALNDLGVRDEPSRPVVLVGHSMGTQVVVELARNHADVGGRVLLVSPVVASDQRTPQRVIDAFIKSAVHEHVGAAMVSVRAYTKAGLRWPLEVAPAMLRYPIEKRVTQLRGRLVVATGEKDRLCTNWWAAKIATLTEADAKVLVIKGAAHQVVVDHADEVADAALDLAGLTPEHDVRLDEPEAHREPAPHQPEVAVQPISLPRKLGVIVQDWAYALSRVVVSVLVDRTPTDAFLDGDDVPVVMLPGIWELWRFQVPLARRLHALGHPVVPIPDLGCNSRDLTSSAERVIAELERLDVRDAVLVAHSKGGLIGKQVLLDSRAAGRVHGLVGLCVPFGGSTLSWRVLARTPLGMFAPAGGVIMGLAAEQVINERIVSIASAWDEMIPQGTFLPGALNEAFEVPGHFLPVEAPTTAALVHGHVRDLAGRPVEDEMRTAAGL